jgi:hypothetical protein
MSRNGRIQLAGKREARAMETRQDELRDLARELRGAFPARPVVTPKN